MATLQLHRHILGFFTLLFSIVVMGCSHFTEHLRKYENPSSSTAESASLASPSATFTAAQVKKITNGKYHFPRALGETWNAVLDVLSKDYNITLVDQSNGVVSTEWDKFFVGTEVYRNKISIHLKRESSATQITLYNNVEKLNRDNSRIRGVVWIPSSDPTAEITRIIRDMSAHQNLLPAADTSETAEL